MKRDRYRIVDGDVAMLGKGADVYLDLCPEAVEVAQDRERIDERLQFGLKLEIRDVLDQLMSEIVTVLLDLL